MGVSLEGRITHIILFRLPYLDHSFIFISNFMTKHFFPSLKNGEKFVSHRVDDPTKIFLSTQFRNNNRNFNFGMAPEMVKRQCINSFEEKKLLSYTNVEESFCNANNTVTSPIWFITKSLLSIYRKDDLPRLCNCGSPMYIL